MHHQVASPVDSSIIALGESFLSEEVHHRTIECQVGVGKLHLGEGLTNSDHSHKAIGATLCINKTNMIVSSIGSFSANNAIS